MAITPDQSASRASRWQFSLRTLLAGVTAFAVLLGIGFWLGPATALGIPLAASLGLLGFAAYARRRRLAATSGILLLLFGAPLSLYWFGPSSEECSACEICGMYRARCTWLGITWYDKPIDTDDSRWYREKQLPTHIHRWRFLCANVQHWGGSVVCYDSFGFFLNPLSDLREASEHANEAAFERLATAYVSLQQGESNPEEFYAVWREVTGAGEEVEPEP